VSAVCLPCAAAARDALDLIDAHLTDLRQGGERMQHLVVGMEQDRLVRVLIYLAVDAGALVRGFAGMADMTADEVLAVLRKETVAYQQEGGDHGHRA
jgi:hypothetical protein